MNGILITSQLPFQPQMDGDPNPVQKALSKKPHATV